MKRIALLVTLFAVSACSTGERTPSSASYKVEVLGGDETSFTPAPPNSKPKVWNEDYDVVVIGGGLAGLSSAVFLSDAGKKVLLLEKEYDYGGLASGGTLTGTNVRFDRGAAYWTSAYEEELEILKRIGMGDYEKHAIPEPIDSYLWNGKLYPGIWEKETMEELPASFTIFKNELVSANKKGLIPNQPFEEQKHLELDKLSAAQWIRTMPASASKRRDKDALEAYHRFMKEKGTRVDAKDPMKDVVDLLDLYCRSALGTTTDQVSAVAFANFYISEIETRYTTQIGTGAAAENMVEILKKRSNVTMKNLSPVVKVKNGELGAQTAFVNDGNLYVVQSKFVIFAGQLKFAPKILEGFAEKAPEQARLMASMDYANYSVHAVKVSGHPYRATYDTWTRAADYTEHDFTDVILGRWMELNGYEGFRDFKKNPSGDSIMTIYHPLSLKHTQGGYDKTQAELVARGAVDRMLEIYNPLLSSSWGTSLNVKGVQTSRWPFSVHVAAPGHFSKKVKIMRRPYGHVFFANNNLGTPAFEEALFRGHCAANNILARLDRNFQPEKWTQCPMEK